MSSSVVVTPSSNGSDARPAEAGGPLRRLFALASAERHAYRPGQHREGAHLAAAGTYSGAVLAAVVLGRVRGLGAPDLTPWEVTRLAAATFKGTRLLAKDTITAPVRIPFTRRSEEGEANEVNDEPRGQGLRRTVGEVLTCPFCLGQWVATGLAAGTVFVPKSTRMILSVLTALAGADFLHHAHTLAQHASSATADEPEPDQ